MDQKLEENKFTAVVPAYNEATRFGHVLSELLKIKVLDELIFVDDGSTDGTKEVIKDYLKDKRVKYLCHKKNKGKGTALRAGVLKAKNEIILFLDADLENITASKIMRIVSPVIKDEVDLARGSFKLARGRVTEIAVKPMMKILFPDLYFSQPISGQVCAKKSFLENTEFESHWGVDIGILLDAIHSGLRIIEVDIGKLEHKSRSMEDKAEMAQQVLETMIEKAGLIRHKYKLVIFTLDDTLINKQSLDSIFTKLGIELAVHKNQQMLESGKINFTKYLLKNAELFEGIKIDQVGEICDKAPLAKYAGEVINSLRRRKYKVAIISSNFSPIVNAFAKRLGVDYVSCVEMGSKKGILSGKILEQSHKHWLNGDVEYSFKAAFKSIIKKAGVTPSEVIMVASSKRSIPLIKASGMGVAYRPKDQELKDCAEKTISFHAELLAIIE